MKFYLLLAIILISLFEENSAANGPGTEPYIASPDDPSFAGFLHSFLAKVREAKMKAVIWEPRLSQHFTCEHQQDKLKSYENYVKDYPIVYGRLEDKIKAVDESEESTKNHKLIVNSKLSTLITNTGKITEWCQQTMKIIGEMHLLKDKFPETDAYKLWVEKSMTTDQLDCVRDRLNEKSEAYQILLIKLSSAMKQFENYNESYGSSMWSELLKFLEEMSKTTPTTPTISTNPSLIILKRIEAVIDNLTSSQENLLEKLKDVAQILFTIQAQRRFTVEQVIEASCAYVPPKGVKEKVKSIQKRVCKAWKTFKLSTETMLAFMEGDIFNTPEIN